MAKPKQNSAEEIRYEPCVITFIDILGFRNLLATRTAAQVFEVMKHLQKFTKPNEEKLKPREHPRLLSRAFSFTVSDAIVRIRPYATKYHEGAFFLELLDLFYAQVELVNRGVPIRAGVTVGDAYVGPNGTGPAFGPALVRAYEIESEEAVYPRIVVDDYALEQHKIDKRLRSETNPLEYEIREIEALLAIGEDGIRYIDYLSAENLGEFDHPGLYLDFLQRHADLVRVGLRETNKRTFRKYMWLARYHNAEITRQRAQVMGNRRRRKLFETEYEVDPEEFYNSILIKL